jgi:UDP-N-acetylmuramoylalanine--D-glutamate ligase
MPIHARKALVYGLGRSGLAAARLLAHHGAQVVFYDDQATRLPPGPWEGSLLHSGKLPTEALAGVDLAVVSPGVHPDTPVFLAIQAAGIPLMSEIELASRVTEKPLVGVTGTNGKSTTVTLVEHMLRAAGHGAVAVGNIGYPFSSAVLERADVDWYAVEVSSYQLATIDRFSVRGGIITNLAPNHHQWHGGEEAYWRAKLRLFENTGPDGVAVYPAGSAWLARQLERFPVRKIRFTWGGAAGEVDWDPAAQCIVWRETGEHLVNLGEWSAQLDYDYHSILWNLMAAVALGRGLGLPGEAFGGTLKTFRPLEHRMEPVRQLDGVRWINDSKSTNIDSTRYAIENTHSPVVLMLGGRDKGLDFAALTAGHEEHIRSVVALGECREKIAGQLRGRVAVQLADGFEPAIVLARSLAREGDTVLFSPACASFDMFKDFEHRGRTFKDVVRSLPSLV